MSMSIRSVIAKCPECKEEFLFKTKAKRPRPHCPNCNEWFYVRENNTQNTQEEIKNTKPLIKKFDNLDEATIEKLILDLLNEEATESRIKLAVDFHNKVKGTDAIRLEEPLDMEGFLIHELHEREKESNPSVH